MTYPESNPAKESDIETLFHLAPCGILEFDESGVILSANAQMHRYLEVGPIGGMKFEQLLTVSSRIFYQTHFFPLLKLHGHAEEIFLTLHHGDGSPVPMFANAVRQLRQNGWTTLCAFMPVHQRGKYEEEILQARKRAEDALNSNEDLQRSRTELEKRLRELDRNLSLLEQRNQELLRLNDILSHDLREPVRKIRAFANLFLEENFGRFTPEAKFAIERIDAACLQISDLIRVLQEFAWIDADNEVLSQVNLNELVTTAAHRLDPPLSVYAESLPAIEGYPSQLAKLFERLFRSARARHASGALEVRITCSIVQHNTFRNMAEKYNYADFAQITVTDNAAAYNCTDCDSLFKLLRKTGEFGSHPDLAICQKIVDHHYGTIGLRSPQGFGATYTILLPVQQQETEL